MQVRAPNITAKHMLKTYSSSKTALEMATMYMQDHEIDGQDEVVDYWAEVISEINLLLEGGNE